jgi:hypothetical protein
MWKRKQPPAEFVYLSLNKLKWLAGDAGVKTSVFGPVVEVEKSAAAELGVPSVGTVSLGRRVQGTRNDWGMDARALRDVLAKVMRRLPKLPDLERGDLVREGGYFSFHRNLKFGVGHSDAGPPVKALIAVDRIPLPYGSPRPGLLMNGSVAHVLDPYATDELRAAASSRSGSGTERLFNWLEEVRGAEEAQPAASWSTILSHGETPPPKSEIAMDMYRLFASEDWLAPYLAEPLMHGGPCEGVARASHISIGDEGAVVMGSPLFIRLSPLPD